MYGANGGVTRVKVSGADFDTIRERVLSRPDQITKDVELKLNAIGATAVDDIKAKILSSGTKTGARAQAAGKRSTSGRLRGAGEVTASRPRVAGRSMYDSVSYKVTVNRRSISLRYGWLSGRPGYAFFQEYGTSNGVPAMHALTDAKLKADIKLKGVLR